jgi:DNA-binding MarR family transcriptional regulator
VAHAYQDQLLGECDEFMINISADRPIGYWLKKLNNLIDAEFERQLGEASLSRRQWQVLNLIEDGPRSVPELESELEPFLRDALQDLAEAQDLEGALSGLVTRGWAESMDNIVSLTETGQAQFGLLKARVAELRQALTAGISAEEYQATIDVLARMAANLESPGKTGDQIDQESRSAGQRATPSMTVMGDGPTT